MEMVDELNALDLSDVKDSDVLTSIAFIFSMAHNLDLGTAPKAKEVFERSLSMNPDNLRSNYLFGMFLVSTREHHFDAPPVPRKSPRTWGERRSIHHRTPAGGEGRAGQRHPNP
jgi:hypothetical protein